MSLQPDTSHWSAPRATSEVVRIFFTYIKLSGPVQVQGVNVELKGQAKITVQGSAMAEIKGGVVKIN